MQNHLTHRPLMPAWLKNTFSHAACGLASFISLTFLAFFFAPMGSASGNTANNNTTTNSAAIVSAVENFVRNQTRKLPGQVDIQVTSPEGRTQLAPCNSFDPFIPPGNKLWGKTMVGIRCQAPASWTIYLPVQVRVQGNYLVTTRAISPGQILSPDDIAPHQGDLTSMPAGLLSSPEQAIGKTLKNSLAGGQALRADMLQATPVIIQGQDVKIIYKGSGFSISNEGKALNNAADGQLARARIANGQTISGTARPGGIIEITQ